jgi:hypothetical protein
MARRRDSALPRHGTRDRRSLDDAMNFTFTSYASAAEAAPSDRALRAAGLKG